MLLPRTIISAQAFATSSWPPLFLRDIHGVQGAAMAEDFDSGTSLKRKQGLKSQKVVSVRGHEFLPASFKTPVQCCHCKIYIWCAG